MAQQGLLDFQYPQLVNLDRQIATKRFDLVEFNKKFEAQKEAVKQQNLEINQQKLMELNEQEALKKPYELTFAEMLIGIKDTWFEIIDDLLQQKFYMETFTKNNRLFYIGLTFIIIVILVYLYDIILGDI